jgi:signal transduction histidine kinase
VRPARWTVRVRLTVLYTGAFLAAGVVLVAVTYGLVSWSLREPIAHRLDSDAHDMGSVPNWEIVSGAIESYRSAALGSLLTWSLLALAGALVLAVGLGWMLSGRALRPLRQVTETANRVAGRSLHERIALAGPSDEVKELADTIDAMLERLDQSFDAQRRFVANASHELRTPLAVNRTLIEVAIGSAEASDDLKQLAPTLLATNDRSEQLIEGLLTLARSEHEVSDRVPLDLADLAAVAVEHEKPEADERRITVATGLEAAPVKGNAVLVERMAVNLVQNAVRHSPSGIEAVVRTGRRGDRSVIEVENPGRVLRQYEVDGMFEPFRHGDGRVGTNRGAGLGLSIVRSVAQAHGGTAKARPREGGGLVVLVELPSS